MKPAAPVRRDIVLIGGGHAHVAVLKAFGMRPEPGVRLNLISPDSLTPYSGMLPGYLAGHYSLEETHVDLRPLCRFAGARFYRTRATGIDLVAGAILCDGHPAVPFDLLSLDIGSTPTTDGIEGAERAIGIKPVDRFLDRWAEIEKAVLAGDGTHRLAVVGAGAGGVEAALALNHRVRDAMSRAGRNPEDFRTTILSQSDEPMESHAPAVRRRMAGALAREGIGFQGGAPVVAVEPEGVRLAGGARVTAESIVLVTPGRPAGWLASTGLPLDERGFLEVDEHLRSTGDPRVFGAGDTIAFGPRPLPKSGVYAVRAGPVLADNLRRAATERALRPFRPQRRTLALVSMGRKRAVLSYGPLAAEGDWAWRFKDWIDRRWMRKYNDLPDMAGEEASDLDTDPMRCGGCGAKLPSDILRRVLDRVVTRRDVEGLRVGLDAPDDAAVFALPPGKLIVQTVDQFRAFVDDPYLFGRIAANHCLGDIHAMGATPVSALAAIALPFADDAKMEADLEFLLRGALRTFEEAGVALIGGHTAEGAETSLGFTINGFADEGALLRKGGLRAGDRLILTKPLGTGVLLAADMRGEARGGWIDGAVETMLQSNGPAAEIARAHGATAATDVTGFGLAGHLAEMATAAGVSIRLRQAAIPVLEGAEDAFRSGIASSLQEGNTRAVRGSLAAAPAILFDPQTAGGLLLGLSVEAADACLADLQAAGYDAATVIGEARGDGAKAGTIELA